MTMVPPGGVIGILGGGQLGRMLALAAAEYGFDVHVFSPEAESPAGRVAAREWVAGYDDADALKSFAAAVDVVTTEFENVPALTAQTLIGAGAIVRPSAATLAIAQDRLFEKNFLRAHGAATTPYMQIDRAEDIPAALAVVGAPALLKTRRLGYDGKGQVWVRSRFEAEEAFAAIGGAAAILEGAAGFVREVSVIAARSTSGGFEAFDLCENVHRNGVLAETRVPSQASPILAERAIAITQAVAEALDYVGVLTIEFFELADGQLLANEIAPRVHNSGHWTQDACTISQFSQHIRAVAGWHLAPAHRFGDVVMENILGAEVEGWAAFANAQDKRLHLYGKRDVRPGRKLGHATHVTLPPAPRDISLRDD